MARVEAGESSRARARRSSRRSLAAPALAASCRSCVVSPIISVRSGSTPNSRISSSSICGFGLEAVSSAVRVASNRPCSCTVCSASSSPRRDLPVATPEPVVARLQRLQHGQRALEQHDLVLPREVVVAVALAELLVALARQVGRGVLQRLDQAHADHVAGVLVAGHRHAEVGTGGLDAARDQRGRVEQRAVPVEDDQVELAGSGHVGQCVRGRPRILPAAATRARSPRRWRGARSAAAGRAGTCARNAPPPRASALLSAKSPYFASPTIGWPSCARCTRIWCVRPVLMVTSSSVKPAKRCATLTSVIERLASSWSASTARTRRSPSPVEELVQRHVDDLACSPARRRSPAPRRSCRSRARATGPAAPPAPSASWRSAAGPRSPCRAGAPVRGTSPPAAPGAAAR